MVMVNNTDRNGHCAEDQLESYARGVLEEPAAAPVEEHLLICEACRDRLSEHDTYIRSIRAAAHASRAKPARNWWRWTMPRFVPAVAAAVTLLAIAPLVSHFNSPPSMNPVLVTLEATRGPKSLARVPAHQRLLLKPGTQGLAASEAHHLAVVDASGKYIWQGNFRPETGAAVPELSAGTYFVRLYSNSGTLLREYGLDAQPKP
jgi:anti-sigma factor RsiW